MEKNNLPKIIPIFPLSNFILFPNTSVPLNIFEPRYIDMINDSMKLDKLIGMIQPLNSNNNDIISNYPLEDIMVTLLDGTYHDVDSSEIAFKIAGGMAFRDAAKKAGPALLEPLMALEVVVPEDYLGSVMGNVTSRRGNVKGMDARGNVQVLNAEVPLSEMFGYSTDLRSMTQGRAVFTMQFSHYSKAPNYILEQLMENC